MRRDWTGPARTKSRLEWGSALLRQAAMGGWVARRGQPRVSAGNQPRCLVGGLAAWGPDRMGGWSQIGQDNTGRRGQKG